MHIGRFKASATILLSLALLGPTPLCPALARDAPDPSPATDLSRTIAVAPGTNVSRTDGPCLTFDGLRDAIIQDVTIGPCGDNGIELKNSHNVVIRNVTIRDTGGSGIYAVGSTGLAVTESHIARTASGFYAVSSGDLAVSCNTFEDARGPVPRGQHVQFDKVSGGANRISCNIGNNRPGMGAPEDAISLYQSHGSAGSPIVVEHNLIVGGGPSPSGGGIMLGDSGGSHQAALANVLIDPGQYGIAVSSGHAMTIRGNIVHARRQPFTNVGIYAWNQYQSACFDITVEANQVSWRSKTGRSNPFWDGRNCGIIARGSAHVDQRPVPIDRAMAPPPACVCQNQGWR